MSNKGLTLVELIVAMALLGLSVVAFLSSFTLIQRGVIKAKNRTIAVSLCRERMETLKNQRYVLLRPTEQADLAAFGYDATYFPPDLGLSAAGTRFDRFSRVDKAVPGAGGAVEILAPTATDAGLKRVMVWVEWDEEGSRRRHEMTSLLVNPGRSRAVGGITGVVYRSPGGAGNQLAGALVKLDEDPSRSDVSGLTGGYWVASTSGAFTVRASKRGYFDGTAGVLASPGGTANFVLSPRGAGSVQGTAYLRDHLVVSQVVVATTAPDGFDVQLVELYNPTTSALFVGSVSSHSVRLQYQSPYLAQDCADVALEYVNPTIAPLSSYLIANASSFILAGATVTADAYFADAAGAGCAAAPSSWTPPAPRRLLESGRAGSVVLRSGSGAVLDAVGWMEGATAPAYCEGACIPLPSGLGAGEQLARRASAAAGPYAAEGRAFDSNDNSADFLSPLSLAGLEAPARVSAMGTQPAVSGTPAGGAVVSVDDDLSSPVLADASGFFLVPGVATCTAGAYPAAWTLIVASGAHAGEVFGVTPPDGGTADVGAVALVSSAAAAQLTGTVTSSLGGPAAGLLMQAGGATAVTDGAGFYRLVVDPGAVAVAANYGRSHPGFAEETSATYTLNAGQAQSGVDFVLDPVGAVRGVVTTNGIDPYPGNLVRAFAPPGTERGSATADASGAFRITGLPVSAVGGVGTYTISPAVDTSQTATPASASVTLTQGAEVVVSTFTVASSMGLLTGTVADGGAPITTGVLVLASLASVGGAPPVWDESLRGGSTMYYAAHARNDGTWSLPVRVHPSQPYNVYAWYSKPDGSNIVTTLKSSVQLVDSSSGAFVVPFAWP